MMNIFFIIIGAFLMAGVCENAKNYGVPFWLSEVFGFIVLIIYWIVVDNLFY